LITEQKKYLKFNYERSFILDIIFT